MTGNVSEWVLDVGRSRPSRERIDPSGPRKGDHRIIRGGSWFTDAESSEIGVRDGEPADDQRGDVGFRLIRLADIEL